MSANRQNVLLYGPRRYGKSSLASGVAEELRREGRVCIWFDMKLYNAMVQHGQPGSSGFPHLWMKRKGFRFSDSSEWGTLPFVSCLVRHGKVVKLIQVAYTVEGEKTRKREIPPFFGAGRKLGCDDLVVVTDHESEEVSDENQTVHVVVAKDWLLR